MSWLKAIAMILTLTCEQSTQLVSTSLDRQLSFAERWAVRLHAIGCWSCRRFRRQLMFLRRAFQEFDERADRSEDEPNLSPAARKKILTALRGGLPPNE